MGKSTYLSLTNDLFNLYLNDPTLIPRSIYRKNVGDGVRTISYGAQLVIAQANLRLTSQLQGVMKFFVDFLPIG